MRGKHFLQYPHDPNLTVNVLIILLWNSRETSTTGLPAKLCVQMDNCGRENKNQMVFWFMALLVQQNIILRYPIVYHINNTTAVNICMYLLILIII